MDGQRPDHIIIDEVFSPELIQQINKEAEEKSLLDDVVKDELPFLTQSDEPYVVWQHQAEAYAGQMLVDEPSVLEQARFELQEAHKQAVKEEMNRAERREHNRRNGRNSDGSPKKRAL